MRGKPIYLQLIAFTNVYPNQSMLSFIDVVSYHTYEQQAATGKQLTKAFTPGIGS